MEKAAHLFHSGIPWTSYYAFGCKVMDAVFPPPQLVIGFSSTTPLHRTGKPLEAVPSTTQLASPGQAKLGKVYPLSMIGLTGAGQFLGIHDGTIAPPSSIGLHRS